MTPEELRELILEIHGHLGAAIIQSLPSDDQIIMGHVREAYAMLRTILEGTK